MLSEGALQLPSAEIDLSLVIPFYNPGLRLASHVQDVVGVLRAEHVTFEVIAVSDGSTDGSPSSIAGIDKVRIVELAKNQGKGAALRVGLAQGRGRYLGFIDADGDIPASADICNYFLTGLVLVGPVFVTVVDMVLHHLGRWLGEAAGAAGMAAGNLSSLQRAGHRPPPCVPLR